MGPDRLFLNVINECRQILEQPTDYNVLRSSALVRQLLLDGTSLVDVVNRKHRLQIEFTVRDPELESSVENTSFRPSVMYVLDTIWPGTTDIVGNIIKIDRSKFLKLPVVFVNEQYFTISEIIKICSNVLGGVHIGKAKTDKEKLLTSFQPIMVGGAPLNVRQLLPILQIVIEALEPLERKINGE